MSAESNEPVPTRSTPIEDVDGVPTVSINDAGRVGSPPSHQRPTVQFQGQGQGDGPFFRGQGPRVAPSNPFAPPRSAPSAVGPRPHHTQLAADTLGRHIGPTASQGIDSGSGSGFGGTRPRSYMRRSEQGNTFRGRDLDSIPEFVPNRRYHPASQSSSSHHSSRIHYEGQHRVMETVSEYQLQGAHSQQPEMNQNNRDVQTEGQCMVAPQVSWSVPPNAPPAPPVLIGQNYIVLFNSNPYQQPGCFPPNFHFVGQPKPQVAQYDPTLGLYSYGSSNIGLEYDYTTVFDANYGVPPFTTESNLAQMGQMLAHPPHIEMVPELPPLGTTYFVQQPPSMPAPEFAQTSNESISNSAASECDVSVASTSTTRTVSATASSIKLNPNAPEYIPKSMQNQGHPTAPVQTQTALSAVNRSWSEQMDSHDMHEEEIPLVPAHDPLRSSTPIFTNSTYASSSEGFNRSRRGSGESGGGRGRGSYYPRGGRNWYNYDYDEQDPGGYGGYRGRGGRGRGGRGRGRGGRGRGAFFRDDYYEHDGCLRPHSENVEQTDLTAAGNLRMEPGPVSWPNLPGIPAEVMPPPQAALPGPLSYASALSSGLTALPCTAMPMRKRLETAQERVLETTYFNSAFKNVGEPMDRGQGIPMVWTNQSLNEKGTQCSTEAPSRSAPVRKELSEQTARGDTKPEYGETAQQLKEKEGECPTACVSVLPDTNNNDARTKHEALSSEINAGDGIGIGDCTSNDSGIVNTGVASVDGAKGEPAQF